MEDKTAAHVQALTAVLKDKSDKTVAKTIKLILSCADEISEKDIESVKKLLNMKNPDIVEPIAHWIAELASKSDGRKKFVDVELIKLLFSELLNENSNSCNAQLCRALGNITMENVEANRCLMEMDAMSHLINLLDKHAESDEIELLSAAVGFLQNHLLSDLDMMKQAVDLNVLKLAERVLAPRIEQIANCERLFTNTLCLVVNLTQHVGDTWISNEMCLHLVRVLELSTSRSISELVLDVFHNEAENDEIKKLLAEAHLCELLFNLLEKHRHKVRDMDGRALLKLACDLIVLVLTGVPDESMIALYGGGKGRVYLDMLKWLDSKDPDLVSTAVLAIGNFARKDSHCIEMVQAGVAAKLLKILAKYNNVGSDVRLQHALLSALRNLVIPQENKARLMQAGLIDVIFPLLGSRHQVVLFKLLGTLRMLVDGQAETALQLAMRADMLEKVVEWSFTSEHPGVRAECLRLVAWLIKHCHSAEPFPRMLRIDKFLRCLVEMLTSSHALMQNEALVALSILCAANPQLPDAGLDHKLIECELVKFLTFLLSRHGDTLEQEMVENVLTLLELLVQSQALADHLRQPDLLMELKKMPEREALSPLRERITHVLAAIDSS